MGRVSTLLGVKTVIEISEGPKNAFWLSLKSYALVELDKTLEALDVVKDLRTHE